MTRKGFITITDDRSIIKQVVGGLTLAPVIIAAIAFGSLSLGVFGLAVFLIFSAGWRAVIDVALAFIGYVMIGFIWFAGFVWSRPTKKEKA